MAAGPADIHRPSIRSTCRRLQVGLHRRADSALAVMALVPRVSRHGLAFASRGNAKRDGVASHSARELLTKPKWRAPLQCVPGRCAVPAPLVLRNARGLEDQEGRSKQLTISPETHSHQKIDLGACTKWRRYPACPNGARDVVDAIDDVLCFPSTNVGGHCQGCNRNDSNRANVDFESCRHARVPHRISVSQRTFRLGPMIYLDQTDN